MSVDILVSEFLESNAKKSKQGIVVPVNVLWKVRFKFYCTHYSLQTRNVLRNSTRVARLSNHEAPAVIVMCQMKHEKGHRPGMTLHLNRSDVAHFYPTFDSVLKCRTCYRQDSDERQTARVLYPNRRSRLDCRSSIGRDSIDLFHR